jgi:Putative addiction module component
MTAASADRVIEQAMGLPKAKQRVLLSRLWRKLAPAPPTMEEIQRRVESVRNGTAKLVSMEEMNEALDRRRAAAIKRLQKNSRSSQ